MIHRDDWVGHHESHMGCGLLTQQVMYTKLRYDTLRGDWVGFLLNIIKWKAARFFS